MQQRRIAIHADQGLPRPNAVAPTQHEHATGCVCLDAIDLVVLEERRAALREDGLQQFHGLDGGITVALEGGVVAAAEGVARVVLLRDASGVHGAGGRFDIARFVRRFREQERARFSDARLWLAGGAPGAPVGMCALRERPELAHGRRAIALAGEVVIGVDAAQEEAGVAAAGAEPEPARVGDGYLAAGGRGEEGGAAAGEAGADDEEIGFV